MSGVGSERESLVRQIIQEFSRENGTVNWSKAFEAHPEWKDALGAHTWSGMQHCYNMSNRLRREKGTTRPRKNARAMVHVRAKAVERAHATPVSAAPLPVMVSGIPHCPGCGMGLQLHHQVHATMQQMQQMQVMEVLQSMPPEQLAAMMQQHQQQSGKSRRM